MNEKSHDGDASREQGHRADGIGTQIAALFRGLGLDRDIPELRGYQVKPPEFDPINPWEP